MRYTVHLQRMLKIPSGLFLPGKMVLCNFMTERPQGGYIRKGAFMLPMVRVQTFDPSPGACFRSGPERGGGPGSLINSLKII